MILRDPGARPVIAHRGNRAHAPEDTIPALLEAVALGVDAVELDLRVTSDGHLVVMHDPTLDRTTDSTGGVAARTLRELQQCDAGHWFTPDAGRTYPWRGRGAHVPSFDEVVESLPRDLPMILELKTAAATPALQAAITRHQLARRVVVAGFQDAAVRPLRGSGVTIGASTLDVVRILPGALLGRQVTAPCDVFCIPPVFRGLPVPIPAIARAVRSAGTPVHVWTVNDPAHASRLWAAGVNGIISDDPGAILAVRTTQKPAHR